MRQLDQPPCRLRSVLRVGFERLTPWSMRSIAVRLDDTQTASMVLLMQLEHYTATILESWDAKYSSCRRHVRRALAAAEAPGGSTADLIWTPSQIVLLDVDEDDACDTRREAVDEAEDRRGTAAVVPVGTCHGT